MLKILMKISSQKLLIFELSTRINQNRSWQKQVLYTIYNFSLLLLFFFVSPDCLKKNLEICLLIYLQSTN